MPLRYTMDDEHHLVLTTGHGVLTDQEVFEYKQSVWSLPKVAGYDELLDLREVERLDVPSTERLRELARLSAAMDVKTPTKLAIVADDLVTAGVARIYEVMRRMDERSTKQVAVFRAVEEAIEWLKPPQPEGPRKTKKPAPAEEKHNPA